MVVSLTLAARGGEGEVIVDWNCSPENTGQGCAYHNSNNRPHYHLSLGPYGAGFQASFKAHLS